MFTFREVRRNLENLKEDFRTVFANVTQSINGSTRFKWNVWKEKNITQT